MLNDGVLIGRREADYIGGTLPFFVRNESGDWRVYEPPAENQSSNLADAMACVSYSACHSIETQIYFLTGEKVDYSERWLALMSETTKNGNYQYKVADTIRQYGLVRQESWPVPVNFTWDEYYVKPSPEQQAKLIEEGKEWLKKWNVGYEWLNESEVAQHLKQVPIQIVITKNNPRHAVLLVNQLTYFDSYPPYEKSITPAEIYNYFKILVRKNMEFYFVQVDGEKDVWLVREGKRSLVYNLAAFNLVGDWSQIKKITKTELDAIPDTGIVLAGLNQE
jgi:hypothetical protein